MKKSKLTPYLGALFLIAVIIPAIILSGIAIRSLSREEAYIERRIKNTLLAEATHTASLIQAELKNVQQELNTTAPSIGDTSLNQAFQQWQERSLVDAPFLVASDGRMLYPEDKGQRDEKAKLTLSLNKKFFTNEARVPVYENIAEVYQEEILKEAEKLPSKLDEDMSSEALGRVRGGYSREADTLSVKQQSPNVAGQMLQGVFDRHEPVRKKVYEQAKKGGKQIGYRKVNLPDENAINLQGREGKSAVVSKQESIFISELKNFRQIIAQADSGIIPRIIEDKLRLLFWKKLPDGRVVGCVIDQKNFKDRILGVLPDLYSAVRILTVLDENGIPLIRPLEEAARDWRFPFVAREISAMLPHWEVAAYLTDPGMISSKAGTAIRIIWVLVFILFISIVSGGTLVLKSLHSEMALAKKKSTFVANVSHELKTPLTSIRMFAEMLKERRQPDADKQQKYLGLMVSETERLTRLINNVLDFSRREQGKKQYSMEEVNVIQVCRELVEGQRPRLENNGFVVNFSTDINEVSVEADGEALKQALLNLLSNAEKYSGDKKCIDVDIHHDNTQVSIEVKDKGTGISAGDAKKIFKEFYRADDTLTSRTKGTGLGLTIAQQIIKDHGGDLNYSPREGGGSVFRIALPRYARS